MCTSSSYELLAISLSTWSQSTLRTLFPECLEYWWQCTYRCHSQSPKWPQKYQNQILGEQELCCWRSQAPLYNWNSEYWGVNWKSASSEKNDKQNHEAIPSFYRIHVLKAPILRIGMEMEFTMEDCDDGQESSLGCISVTYSHWQQQHNQIELFWNKRCNYDSIPCKHSTETSCNWLGGTYLHVTLPLPQ